MGEFAERAGLWGAAAVALLLGGSTASADTIYLNPRGLAQREQIAQGIQPAQLFDDANGLYLRCRIISSTPAAWGSGRPTLQIEAWSLAGPGRYVWSAQPYTIGMDIVASIHHEFDSHLDLQLMLSSRDEPDAPIGSPAWAARMNRVLDPGGAVGLSRAARPQPAETAAERAGITRTGWVLHHLVEDPLPVLPAAGAGAAARAEYDRLLAERQTRIDADLRANGMDVLHPRSLVLPARDAILGLVEGIARAEKFRFLAERQARHDQPPPLPARANRRIGRDFVERATIAAGFLCTLAEAPAPERPDERAILEAPAVRYMRYGREARDGLLTVLEAANPMHVPLGAGDAEIRDFAERMDREGAAALAAQLRSRPGPRLSPAATLALEPAELAMAAMRVIQEFETFWYADADARRLASALVALARIPDAGASPMAQELSLEARETLVRMLRPDLRGDALRAEEARIRLTESARFREVLDPFFTDADPAVREAMQTVVAHAGFVPVSTDKAVEELFSLATGDGVPDDTSREMRRASRRYAITVLTLLGGLADPDAPGSADDREVAERVFARLQSVRDSVEAGQGTRGQSELLGMLPELPERINEPALRGRVARFLRYERDHVRARHGRARTMLEEAASGSRVLSEDERLRFFEEARRLGRRLDTMRVPE